MLQFSYGTDGFHLDIPKDGKAKSVIRDGLLLTTDAARRPGLNVLLCDDMEQQRLNYAV